MKQYRTINNLTGWLTFIIAATVYCLTIEPTASFWDCPEFITTGYKLEVGHPPGAPFFMLVANLFTQFASDTTTVAKMVNYMSALMSGACIMFLFWSITHLVRKLVVTDENNITAGQIISIMGSGLVGALAYTFSDTFWFSAVEGEVYAFSSLFTAIVFWLILKWEDVADQPHSDRWLILIAYLTGLSIGVHLLNLLCLPAIVLVYYYKKTPNATAKGSLMALIGSAVLVAVVLYGIVPGIVKVGGWFELLFVNGLGTPFNTGVVVYIIVLAAALIWSVYESYNEKSPRRMAVSFILTVALLGIPFYGHGVSSVLIGVVVIALLSLYLAPKTQERVKAKWRVSARTMNTALLCIMMIVIGYSSYALIVIRSTANTPMDQNSPEDIFTLGEYLGREQYGTRPLFYGPAYSSQVALDVEGEYCVPRKVKTPSKYARKEKTSPDEKDSYIALDGGIEYEYAQNMLFPRMYSPIPQHIEQYKSWANIKGHDVPYDQCGKTVMVNIPTQWENIKFFFAYQLNFMYWRYFMWNFAGRQNDIQGSGEIENGNWITGFPFIDKYLVGDQSQLPKDMKENKGRNVYYCLPLILGLIGLFWQAYRNQKGIQQFWVVFFLFFMTGIAIVLYLNQTPIQPRERDYAYAGSFYAFAIWIGMGVAGLIQKVSRLKPELRLAPGVTEEEVEKLKNQLETKRAKFITPEEEAELQSKIDSMYEQYTPFTPSPVVAAVVSVICLLVPIQMAGQTWDDHDRSDRYMARDFGQNYLSTLQEEGAPIIFTNGDNDTFPLWYNLDTEGFRTDTRTCNLSYLQTDWYIDQMKRPAYESPSLPIKWDRTQYVTGQGEFARVQPEFKAVIDTYFKQANELAAQGDTTVLSLVKSIFGENPYELKEIIDRWILGKNEMLKEFLAKTNKDIKLPLIPTDSIVMKIDKEAVRRSGMKIPEALGDSIPDYMHISLAGQHTLYKHDFMILDMIANANWERPIYMAITVGSESYHINLGKHFIQEGLAYRITPFDTEKLGCRIDSEKMYDNLMHKFKFGGIEKPGIYIDENAMRMCYTHRRIFAQLIGQLINEGKKDKALEVIEYAEKMIPGYNVPHNWDSGAFQLADYYYQLGQKEKGEELVKELAERAVESMTWYLSLSDEKLGLSGDSFLYSAGQLDALVKLLDTNKSEELSKQYDGQLNTLYGEYVQRMGLTQK